MFEVGEWAVLRHNSGGRLFQVGKVGEPDDEGRYRVWERSERREDLWFDVWNSQLIKVENRNAATMLIALMEGVQAEHRKATREVEIRTSEKMEQAIFNFLSRRPAP